MNLIEKYLAKAAGKEHVAPGQDLTCKVSFVAAHDVTAPIAIRMFREIGVKKVFDPSRVALIVDHVYPAATEKARANVWAMDDFSKEFGVPLYQRGEGVIHQLMYEKHKQNPGDIVCIADSHTGTCGGYGQIGIGVGSTELAAAMATGTLDLEVPQVVQIYLTGKRPSNVFGKDLILYLGSKFGSDYLVDRGLLLTGPGIDDLSIAERMTVCNMGIEIGSMITIFGTEEKESDCFETYEIDLSTLEPQISCPFSPANVVPVREKAGIKVTQVVVGSCTNGRLNDMEQVAKAFKGKKVSPDVNVLIVPASRRDPRPDGRARLDEDHPRRRRHHSQPRLRFLLRRARGSYHPARCVRFHDEPQLPRPYGQQGRPDLSGEPGYRGGHRPHGRHHRSGGVSTNGKDQR